VSGYPGRILSVDPDHSAVHWGPAQVGLIRILRVTLAATATRAESTHRVLEYADRLAVHHGDSLSWSDLASIRDAIWGPGVAAVEVFPPAREVIDLRPTRHLWRSDLVDRAVRECSDRMHALHAPQGKRVANEREEATL